MAEMKTVYDTIIACRNTSSKNEKLAILDAQKDDRDLCEFLRVVYEPRINFYQTKVDTKIGIKQGASEGPWIFTSELFGNIVALIAGRKITGNTAKQWLANCYASLSDDWERELLVMLIERDVRAGFSESTINKVWPGLVTDVPYMRCSLPKDSKLNSFDWKNGVISQVKADGMFANVNRHATSVEIFSRNGSPFPNVPAFDQLVVDIQTLIPPGFQLHGELLMFKDGVAMNRQEGNGKFNTLLKSGELGDGYSVVFECWDIIPITEAAAKNKYKVPYNNRYDMLRNCLLGTSWALRRIETKLVHSLKEAYDHYRDALARGLEGTIVKDSNMIWEDSTSKWQVKLKLEFEVDLEVYDYEEGKGKNAGMLGALKCRTSDGKLLVDVGSGFSDEQRKDIWERRDLKIITAKSNSIMPPTRKDTYSLFLPIFVEERLDKTEADSLARVLEQYDAAVSSAGEV